MYFCKVRSLQLLTIIVLVTVLFGCSNSEYNAFRSNFGQLYVTVADSVKLDDTLSSVRNIDLEENKRNISKMKELLDNIEGKVPDNMKRDYEQLTIWYTDMASLQGVFNNWDKLSSGEKGEVYNRLLEIDMRARWVKEE